MCGATLLEHALICVMIQEARVKYDLIDCLRMSMQRDQQGQWRARSLVGNTFTVEWQRRYNLPMSDANHLTNPWNEGQPVRIGRDGQEMPASVGKQLVDIIDRAADAGHVMKPSECRLIH